MKTWSRTKFQILNTENDSKMVFIRLVVGLIFISEGIQKYLFLEVFGPAFFQDIGFEHAFFWAHFTGAFEIICGAMILLGFLTRLATIPLFIVMITAFITTKLPILATKGFWTFAHDYDIDFAVTVLLVLLIINGSGKWSIDSKIPYSAD
jgi:putative oxidoreductase